MRYFKKLTLSSPRQTERERVRWEKHSHLLGTYYRPRTGVLLFKYLDTLMPIFIIQKYLQITVAMFTYFRFS